MLKGYGPKKKWPARARGRKRGGPNRPKKKEREMGQKKRKT
jgi:hypothetical protein